MYTEYFGLKELPFSIAPNPHYLFMSQRHRDALAHLLYGVQSDGGFILLTGEVGTGKTTLCRCLLEQIPTGVDTAFVLNPRVSAVELLATICDEFGIEYDDPPGIKDLVDKLNQFLLQGHAAGRKAVLIIDEAQNLSRDLLEQLRLLTNLETSERKLLQIILLGQPELLDMLAQANLRQFSQRITARSHLEALSSRETREYVAHRMSVAGGDPAVFTASALRRVHRLSDGIPRVINLICDRALLGAYARDLPRVSGAIVRQAATEVLGKPQNTFRLLGPALGFALIMLAIVGSNYLQDSDDLQLTESPVTPDPEAASVAPPLKQVSTVTGHTHVNDAYHDLFTLWGAAFEDRNSPPCELASAIGLRCHSLLATSDQLIRLNRPVLVQINNTYLTISELNGDHVTLIAGDRQHDLTLMEFNDLFDGRIHLLWRTPPDYRAPLRISDQGAAVDWLVVQLSTIAGDTPPMETGFTFDEQVEARVKAFQASVGLTPNGIVDTLTWIHLNSVEAISIPTLTQAQVQPAQGRG